VRQVPPGRVVTYGQIAGALGNARRARMVGWAMRACPEDVPWHRVVNAKGGLSTRAPSGTFNPQRAFLEDEGVRFDHNGRIDLHVYGWDEFKP
jgi:methylated-DNA-protein-cysteine methyltransferase-like protein